MNTFKYLRRVQEARRNRRITSSAALVATALATDYADRRGECWPSFDTLAQRLGLARSTVAAAIRQLVAVGLIERTRRYRRAMDRLGRRILARTSNLYRLIARPKSENEAVTHERNIKPRVSPWFRPTRWRDPAQPSLKLGRDGEPFDLNARLKQMREARPDGPKPTPIAHAKI